MRLSSALSTWMVALVMVAWTTPAFADPMASVTSRKTLGTLSLTPCVSYMGGTVSSTSSAAFTSTFTQAFKDCLKTFCSTSPCESTCALPGPFVPTSPVVAEALATAEPALATATATATTSVMSRGFVAGDCSGYISTVSASAKAQTMAKAISTSYASAFASVVGQQSYSSVFANISVATTALQAACLKEFTDINNGPTYCTKTSTKCTRSTIPGGTARWDALSVDQRNKCYIVECTFAQPGSSVTSVVETSAQAIADAVATVTITQNSVCTYNGQERTCAEFTTLCNAVCNGLECRNPVATDYCSPDQGDWVELPNHDYQCQPSCTDPDQYVEAVCEMVPCDQATGCVGQSCHWACVSPPPPTCENPSICSTYRQGCGADGTGYCGSSSEDEAVCFDCVDTGCPCAEVCTSSSECGPGKTCLVDSCCGYNTCVTIDT